MPALFLVLSLAAMTAFQSELIFPPSPLLPSNHASTLAVMPNGDLLCAWYAGRHEGSRDVKIYASRREATSGRWSSPQVIADTPDRSDGNPVLFADQRGRVWLFFVTIHGLNWQWARIKVQNSDDGGRTWGPARIFRERRGWMTRSHPLELGDGRILLPLYNEVRMRSVFMLSDDDGANFHPAGVIQTQPGNLQPSVVMLSDGSLLALLRHHGKPGRIWQASSTDQGRTWSPAKPTSLPNPDAGLDLVRLPNGHLVLAFNNSPTDRTPLSIALSEDDGRTWPWVRDLETDPGEFSYPSLAATPDGAIHLTYTWKRQSIKYATMTEDWIRNGP
jgi:predicted neuraminidase